MKKTTLAIIFTVTLTTGQVIGQDVNDTSALSEQEMIDAILKMQQEIDEEKAKTEAVMKLGKTVDELANQLGVEE